MVTSKRKEKKENGWTCIYSFIRRILLTGSISILTLLDLGGVDFVQIFLLDFPNSFRENLFSSESLCHQ